MFNGKVKVQPPKSVVYRGRNLMLAGRGPTRGSFAYLNPVDGQTLMLHAVRVQQVGTIYAQGVVADNTSFPPVRIDHSAFNGAGPARPGYVYLCGPLSYVGATPKAECAWPLHVQHLDQPGQLRPPQPARYPRPPRPARPPHQVHPPRPAVQRQTGVITEAKPTYGRIVDGTGNSYFVHASQLRPGAMLMVGLRVTFVPVQEARGVAAYDVAFAA